MENLIYIFALLIIISFIRCRSHTQKQFRIEIINDLGINIVRTVVSLIQNNAIKGIWLIPVSYTHLSPVLLVSYYKYADNSLHP